MFVFYVWTRRIRMENVIILFYLCLEFWKRCHRIRALTWRDFLARVYLKVDEIKIKRKVSFFSFLHSFIFLLLRSFPYFFSWKLLEAWGLPLGVVKSRWNGDLAQIINTVFINPVVFIFYLLFNQFIYLFTYRQIALLKIHRSPRAGLRTVQYVILKYKKR